MTNIIYLYMCVFFSFDGHLPSSRRNTPYLHRIIPSSTPIRPSPTTSRTRLQRIKINVRKRGHPNPSTPRRTTCRGHSARRGQVWSGPNLAPFGLVSDARTHHLVVGGVVPVERTGQLAIEDVVAGRRR